jgi:hypothetical protein
MSHSLYNIAAEIRAILRAILVALTPSHFVTPIVTFSGSGIVSFTIGKKETFMAVVLKGGGPFKFDISGFVDDQSNPVTDKDIPVLSSSDESVATIAPDPDDPDGQDGLITLVGPVSAEGSEVVLKADFPAQKYGQAFSVVGHLTVVERAAAGATATITGPGVVDGA